MTTIKKAEYVFSVNTEQTEKYYETHFLCDCGNCRNYYAQIKDKFPKLDAFLREFGVDISKPDEIWSVEKGDYIDYINVDYTVCGSIKSMGQHEIDIYDNAFLSVVITDGSVSPNEQTGECFTFSVTKIELPWVLDEPSPGQIMREPNYKRLFRKIFKR